MTVDKWETCIGRLEWGACVTCKHYPPDKGGCVVPDAEWASKLTTEYDNVYCGAYEARVSDEPTEEVTE